MLLAEHSILHSTSVVVDSRLAVDRTMVVDSTVVVVLTALVVGSKRAAAVLLMTAGVDNTSVVVQYEGKRLDVTVLVVEKLAAEHDV